jgi:D-alanyl-D-alanine carboxypeptidase
MTRFVPLRFAGAIALAIALAAGTLFSAPALAAPPLPQCRIDDVRSRYTQLANWSKTMLDTTLRLPRTYAPDDLRSTARAGLNAGFRVRKVILADLSALAAAARSAHAAIAVNSAYRSFREQKDSFDAYVRQVGYETAIQYGARPGHSEHQLGTTIDFRSAASGKAPWNYVDWATTPPGAWVKEHAWKFGFVMSYPRDKRRQTCMNYEPWHYRYVGRHAARQIHRSGQTLRRYLWDQFETAGNP